VDVDNKMVVAITSRALFDLDEGHEVFEQDGVDAYCEYQIAHEDELLEPGVAFPLVRKLLALNEIDHQRVEVILLSRNSADTGLRIFNSIQHHQLDITRAAFSNGRSPYGYVKAFGSHLFLSTDKQDVVRALDEGVAAASIMGNSMSNTDSNQLCLAFDGDAVIFSDESERIYQTSGLDAFTANEVQSAKTPMTQGPFKGFLSALQSIQTDVGKDRLRIALVTARAAPTHERVIRTLRDWNIRIDEALFLGGLPKGEFLKSLGADIFFDDQRKHCESASEHVATGHVLHGVSNEN
jgi:5'-nucleotidase